MTNEEHRQRHMTLHKMLDELVADWISHTPIDSGKLPSNTTIYELMEWSHMQTIIPSPDRI